MILCRLTMIGSLHHRYPYLIQRTLPAPAQQRPTSYLTRWLISDKTNPSIYLPPRYPPYRHPPPRYRPLSTYALAKVLVCVAAGGVLDQLHYLLNLELGLLALDLLGLDEILLE